MSKLLAMGDDVYEILEIFSNSQSFMIGQDFIKEIDLLINHVITEPDLEQEIQEILSIIVNLPVHCFNYAVAIDNQANSILNAINEVREKRKELTETIRTQKIRTLGDAPSKSYRTRGV